MKEMETAAYRPTWVCHTGRALRFWWTTQFGVFCLFVEGQHLSLDAEGWGHPMHTTETFLKALITSALSAPGLLHGHSGLLLHFRESLLLQHYEEFFTNRQGAWPDRCTVKTVNSRTFIRTSKRKQRRSGRGPSPGRCDGDRSSAFTGSVQSPVATD